ncbi:MAG: hypothetical protein LAO09_21995 [Acidobacteriia bacterium]|nr:hypothetical protein [Terriglobia bacterium]
MPCSYTIDKQQGLVISSGWGVLTGAEILEHQSSLAVDEHFQQDFCQLADFTAVTSLQVEADMVEQLAVRKLFSAKSRRAIVVNTAVAMGLVRMFQTYHELAGGQEQIRIFDDRDQGLQWLFQDQSAAHA